MREWGEALWTARDLLTPFESRVETPLARLERERAARRDQALLQLHAVERAAPAEPPADDGVPIRRRDLWIATTKGFAAGALAAGLLIVSTFWNSPDRPVLVEDVAAQPPATTEPASAERGPVAAQQDRPSRQRTSSGSEPRTGCLAGANATGGGNSPRAPLASVPTGVVTGWRNACGKDGTAGD